MLFLTPTGSINISSNKNDQMFINFQDFNLFKYQIFYVKHTKNCYFPYALIHFVLKVVFYQLHEVYNEAKPPIKNKGNAQNPD